MNRIVIDTNVIISAILFNNSPPGKAVNLANKRGRILLSDTIFQEMQKTITRPKFDRYLSFDSRRQILSKLLLDSELVEITETITVCRDPKDNQFLELAVSGKANFMITGDQDLLVLNPFQGIQIITVNEFLNKVN
ncbi:MAG: putative toxin-antitoxin system toxin component, PIN family [Crocosphaera sp.]